VSALHRFVILFALMYAAFGVSSPFVPAFLQGRGLTPNQLGVLLGAVTAVRLVSGPLLTRVALSSRVVRRLLRWWH
jgi:MFS transporter, PPP family, 3-phenylpropionic acid transporter